MTARESTAQAHGERAVALVNSYGNVIFTGDVHAGSASAHADLRLLARSIESLRPRCERRPAPLFPPPGPDTDRLDREDAVDDFARSLAAGTAVCLHGPEGVGKSYVARAAVEGSRRDAPVVWLLTAGRSAGDALQAVFEALFDAHPRIATPEERRAAFTDVDVTVILEDASAAADAAEQIRIELAGSTVALISRDEAQWGGAGAQVHLEGLDAEVSLALLERDYPAAAQHPVGARRLVDLVRGNPRRLRQAAGVARRLDLPLDALVKALEAGPEQELRRLLLASLVPEDRKIVEVLAGACGATLAVERLRALSGVDDAADRLARMDSDGTVQSGSPRFRLAGALTGLEVPGAQERLAGHLTAVAETHRDDPTPLVEELPAARALVGWARAHDRPDLVIALGRAFAPAALFGHLWDAWGELLTAVLDAARGTADLGAVAWAQHHVGTRAYLRGDEVGAVESLEEALDLRRRLRDGEGAAVTRHNLEFIPRPTSRRQRSWQRPRSAARRGRHPGAPARSGRTVGRDHWCRRRARSQEAVAMHPSRGTARQPRTGANPSVRVRGVMDRAKTRTRATTMPGTPT